jgi:hypothetical protein|tara:strand:- start:5403 stop:5627 length:225 start_codon:yes stop_codon:yes gene_type:complete
MKVSEDFRITQQDESDVIEAEKKEGSKETKYKKLARNIISNKLSTKEVMTKFKSDPDFALWYKNKYTKKLYTYP